MADDLPVVERKRPIREDLHRLVPFARHQHDIVGAGEGGSDRVTLIWPDGTLHNTWLQVTVKASKATGLGADDVFFFANVPGDANSDGAVDLDDFMLLKHHFGTGGLDIGQGDFDLDDDVDLDDFVILKNNFGTAA